MPGLAKSRFLIVIACALITVGWLASVSPEKVSAQLFHKKDSSISDANAPDNGNLSPAEQKKEEKQEKVEEKDKEKSEKAKEKQQSEEAKKPKQNQADRTPAPCLSWVKAGVPVRAVLLCVHGLGLNSDSWTKFGQDMSEQGVATYAIDVRGFGSWLMAKGQQNVNFKDCVDDVIATLNSLRNSNPNKPIFLMGESMGGAIALHVAAQAPELLDGVISVCSSGDRFKQKRTDLQVFLHMFMGPHRKFDIGDKIVDQATNNNPQLKAAWEGDALDEMKLSPVELIQFQRFMNENHDEAKKITKTPVLVVQGRQDPLVKPEGTQELYNELTTPDKQIMMVENAKHLIFEDKQFSAATLLELKSWIMKRCPVLGFNDFMDKARNSFELGQYSAALSSLQPALKLQPGSADAHYLIGLVQVHLHHPVIARQQLIQASRLGKGSQVSKDANRALLTLPQKIVAPHRVLTPGKKTPFVAAALPTVIVFNANWCKPCQDMNKTLDEAKQRFGTRVKFMLLDVDDPANADMVVHYSIGPVPTTVFLTPNGDLVTSQVGYDGMDGMVKGLQKIIPAH